MESFFSFNAILSAINELDEQHQNILYESQGDISQCTETKFILTIKDHGIKLIHNEFSYFLSHLLFVAEVKSFLRKSKFFAFHTGFSPVNISFLKYDKDEVSVVYLNDIPARLTTFIVCF